MRKLQTLFLVLIAVLVVTSCKNGSKKGGDTTITAKKDSIATPKANPNNGKTFEYEGYIIPYNLEHITNGSYVFCSLRETFDEKDPNAAKAVVEQLTIPVGQNKNNIYYTGKGKDYTKVEIYDKDGNKYDCYSTKFGIKGKMITMEGSDSFILENVVITKL